MDTVDTKKCIKCGKIFPATVDYFYKDSAMKSGLKNTCKVCVHKYYNKNKQRISEYYKNNKDKVKEYSLEYRKANKDKIVKYRNDCPYFKDKMIKEIKKYEDVVCDKNGFAIFKCAYCGKEFLPSKDSVRSRLRVINGGLSGECRLYCQDSCKRSCPTYYKGKYPDGFKKASSREANPLLRQIVLRRDNYMCQKCGSTEFLHCHHVVPATQNPMLANDPDMCTTLCKKCHKEVHMKDGCRYHELRCK